MSNRTFALLVGFGVLLIFGLVYSASIIKKLEKENRKLASSLNQSHGQNLNLANELEYWKNRV